MYMFYLFFKQYIQECLRFWIRLFLIFIHATESLTTTTNY